MTDLGWEQSQLCGQEVPIKSEAIIYRLWRVKENPKKIPQAYTLQKAQRASRAIPQRKQLDSACTPAVMESSLLPKSAPALFH